MLPKRLQSGSNKGPKEGPEVDFRRIFDRFGNLFSLFFILPAIGPRKAGGMCVAQKICFPPARVFDFSKKCGQNAGLEGF